MNKEERSNDKQTETENTMEEGENKEVDTREAEKNANAEESENKDHRKTKELEKDASTEEGHTTSATEEDSTPNVGHKGTNNEEEVSACGLNIKLPFTSAKKSNAANRKADTKDVKKKDTEKEAMNNQILQHDTTDGVTVTDTTNVGKQEKFYKCNVKYPLHGPHGKGLCVVFALFTGKTQGYKVDVTNMENFFHGELEYTFMTYRNLTRKQLFEKVEEVKDKIQNERNMYDRLFVVILSHGTKDGILTCEDERGVMEEVKPDDNEILTTEVSDIVDHFKHDKLTSLKGVPKVFLVQTCRGSPDNVAVAAGSGFCTPNDEDDDNLPYNPACPVDGDIMICYATTINHPAYVGKNKGSWFIQDLLGVFKKCYKDHHVLDMMTAINLADSERRHHLKGENITALQMPCLWSSFRKQCYLYKQPEKNGN